jgi:bacillithiol biosynthesis cysteine-adding enzyme BshC
MQILKKDLPSTGYFSDLFLDYLSKKPELAAFYDLFPEEENFHNKAQTVKFPKEKRDTLARALFNQYQGIDMKKEVKENIESLKNENTFTITTGHQLNIFSGPLYFIYKIVTVVKTAQLLNKDNNGLHYVPVYWMASEDHDFEEINHFYLFNKKYTWETDQTGAVGKFNTEGLSSIFAEIKEALPLFQKAYLEHQNLTEATRYFVNELFGSDGLIIIDGDDKELKKEFSAVIKDELINHASSELITDTSTKLENLGYKLQITPREINLFYLDNGIRERIVREGSSYKVLNSEIEFSEKELYNLVENHPEKFSPNVALRPVYQQMILPNICYCGGPAEVAYWLQLKSLCDYYKVSFPLLIPRNFGLFINTANAKKIEKLNVSPLDLFLADHKLKESVIENIAGGEYKLSDQESGIDSVFENIKSKSLKIDVTLEGFVLAEKQKVLKIIEGIEKRLKKAEEGKNEVLLTQIISLKSKLFPDGQLQERRDNFLNFYINDSSFIQKVFEAMDPFDFSFHILLDNE